MPFQELEHTADWTVRVWSQDLPGLFCEAARAMNSLTGIRLASAPRIRRTFRAHAEDPEALLVAFLSELVVAAEHERQGFDEFSVKLGPNRLQVRMAGAAITTSEKAIKAVTYHGLRIQLDGRGAWAEITFDV